MQKKLWREQLRPCGRNGSKGPIIDIYDDDDGDIYSLQFYGLVLFDDRGQTFS
jgi:hypothetical protein